MKRDPTACKEVFYSKGGKGLMSTLTDNRDTMPIHTLAMTLFKYISIFMIFGGNIKAAAIVFLCLPLRTK